MEVEVILPLLALVVGLGELAALFYAWTVPNEWIVFTIFPMMGTPYILGVALVLSATGELGRLCWEKRWWK